jgi:hypothetical protein
LNDLQVVPSWRSWGRPTTCPSCKPEAVAVGRARQKQKVKNILPTPSCGYITWTHF